MKFRAGELEFNATVAEASQAASAQTGDVLRSMTIQFRAQKAAMHELAVGEAQQRQVGGLFSLSETSDETEIEWRVRESTFSYVGSEPWGINHHVWRIEQVERLACTRLILGTVTLEPYEYVEQVSEAGVVRLAARASILEADLDTLARLCGPIDVIRVGISSNPRKMRLDGYAWSDGSEPLQLGATPLTTGSHDPPTGSPGFAVVLACEDVRESRVTLTASDSLQSDDTLDDLIGVLQEKAVLSDQDIQDLKERIRQRRHAARCVADVNAWSL